MYRFKKAIHTTAYSLFLVAVLGISACNKENNYYYYCGAGNEGGGGGGGGQNAITLSSEVRFGAAQRLQDHQIFNGESLSLFVTRTGSVAYSSQLYTNTRITANGAGGFTYSIPMFYPSDGTAVDFFAVHPYAENASLASPLSFAIQTDQTVQENYLKSDLLYGNKTSVAPQIGTIPITFYHRLAKLDFVITSRSAAIDLNRLTEITILGMLPETTIDIQTGRRTVATGLPTTVRAYGSASVSGEVGNQTATGFTAIVVPQIAPEAQRLFGLMIDGRMMYYTPTADFGFASGNKYTVTLNVADTGITESSQIADWIDGGTIGGPAGPQ